MIISVPATWKTILEHRSTADKFAIPRDCELCPADDLPVIAEMVRHGFIRWIDRELFHARINDAPQLSYFECDIYQLTTKGIQLCREHGIEQR